MATLYFKYVGISEDSIFKQYYSSSLSEVPKPGKFTELEELKIHGNSLEEIILDGEKLGLTHVIIENEQYFNKFLNTVYENEEKYPYLIKIFDSNEENYEKLNVKVFKVNYSLFNNFQVKE